MNQVRVAIGCVMSLLFPSLFKETIFLNNILNCDYRNWFVFMNIETLKGWIPYFYLKKFFFWFQNYYLSKS